jgi:hypothetical protein
LRTLATIIATNATALNKLVVFIIFLDVVAD